MTDSKRRDHQEPEDFGGWADHGRYQLTYALRATPAERLAWLERAISLAHRTGALPRPAPELTLDPPRAHR